MSSQRREMLKRYGVEERLFNYICIDMYTL